ncbi:MAG: oligosaccharide flippase family protein [Bacteroidota bacterium]
MKLKKLKEFLGQYRFFDTLMHTKNYFGSYLFIAALGVFSLPVYTHYLSPAEYGIVEVFASLVKAIIIISILNAHTSVGRYYYAEKENFKEFLGSAMVVITASVTLCFVVLWFTSDFIFDILNLPKDLKGFLFPAVVAGVLFAVFNQIFVPRKKSKKVAYAQSIWALGSFLFAIIFIWWLNPNYFGKVAGSTAFMGLLGVYFAFSILQELKLNFSWNHVKYIFWIGLPLLPTALSGFILSYLDQFFIIASEGQEDVGLYSFAYKIGMLLFGFNAAIYNATLPDFFKWKNRNEIEEIKSQEKSMMRFMVLAAGFLVLFASELGRILSSQDDYTVALHLVPVIVCGYLFLGFLSFYTRTIFHSNKNIYISIATLLAGIANIVLNFIYIPIYGYEAAAYTTMVSYLLMLLIGIIVTQFVIEGDKPSMLTICRFLFVFVVVFGLGYLINTLSLPPLADFIYKALIFLALGSFLFWNKIIALINISKH